MGASFVCLTLKYVHAIFISENIACDNMIWQKSWHLITVINKFSKIISIYFQQMQLDFWVGSNFLEICNLIYKLRKLICVR